MEGSFADASRHHFKRSRWRRLWRQQIQDHLIAAIQNIKILIKAAPVGPLAIAQAAVGGTLSLLYLAFVRFRRSASPRASISLIRKILGPLASVPNLTI